MPYGAHGVLVIEPVGWRVVIVQIPRVTEPRECHPASFLTHYPASMGTCLWLVSVLAVLIVPSTCIRRFYIVRLFYWCPPPVLNKDLWWPRCGLCPYTPHAFHSPSFPYPRDRIVECSLSTTPPTPCASRFSFSRPISYPPVWSVYAFERWNGTLG